MSFAAVKQKYNLLAWAYDWIWHRYLTRSLSFLKTWANLPAEARVLDVACGTGLFEQFVLADQPTQAITGTDVSRSMIGIAAQRLVRFSSVGLVAANATKLPFANDYFDVVVCASALHYFESPQTAFREMQRVMKPDGSLVLLDWCRDYPTMHLLNTLLSRFDSAYNHCYTLDELHGMLAENGFRVQASQRVSTGVFWGLMVATARYSPAM